MLEAACKVEEYVRKARQSQSWLRRLLGMRPSLPQNLAALETDNMYRAKVLEDLRARLTALHGRISGPRCLLCGCNHIQEMPSVTPSGSYNQPGLPKLIGMRHPGCGGDLLVNHSEGRIARRLSKRWYDGEGNLLRVEESA